MNQYSHEEEFKDKKGNTKVRNFFDYNSLYKELKDTDTYNVIFDIEEIDSEVLFKFDYKNHGDVIPLLKPKTSGSGISPFSTKNLPKTKYNIPFEELKAYKDIVSKIPSERILEVNHNTNNFLKSLTTKKFTWDDLRADMQLKGLKGKEYIHSIGKWNDYIKYLTENLKE